MRGSKVLAKWGPGGESGVSQEGAGVPCGDNSFQSKGVQGRQDQRRLRDGIFFFFFLKIRHCRLKKQAQPES